jgi:hypothetical protein
MLAKMGAKQKTGGRMGFLGERHVFLFLRNVSNVSTISKHQIPLSSTLIKCKKVLLVDCIDCYVS